MKRKPETNRFVWDEVNVVVGSPRKPTPADRREGEEFQLRDILKQEALTNFIYVYQFKDMKDMEALEVLWDPEESTFEPALK